MERLRTIIVDDEKPARARLIALLADQADIEIVGEGRSGIEALAMVRADRPDLVFLDVQMPGMDGLGVVEEITPPRMPPTVFVTAYEEYAIPAFEVHALDYLLKPFSDERFDSTLEHVRRFFSRRMTLASAGAARSDAGPVTPEFLERLVIRRAGKVMFLPVDDIDWIEAAGVYVNLHAGTKEYLHRSSIANLLQRLDPKHFVRIHRSTVVNMSRVRELRSRTHGDFTLLLEEGRELALSRTYRPRIAHWLRQRL